METSPLIQGAISGTWVLNGVISIMCFLMYRILNRMEKKLDDHELRINDHETRIQLREQMDDVYVSNHNDTFNKIMDKLSYLSGR